MSQLKFKNKKMEDDFIKDMACLRFCIAMLTLAAEGDSYGGDIKIPAIDSNNRDMKKIKEYTFDLKKLTDEVCDKVDNKTINKIMDLNSDFFQVMIKIMQVHTDVSIPHICGYMIEKMLDRDNVYFKLRVVTRVWGIKRIIKLFEKHGIDSTKTEKFIGYSLAGSLSSVKIKKG